MSDINKDESYGIIKLQDPVVEPSSTILSLNDDKLNKVIDDTSNSVLRKILLNKLPKPSKRKKHIIPILSPLSSNNESHFRPIPKPLQQLLTLSRICDEPNLENRLYLFIAQCKLKNYSYATTMKYFNILRHNNYFGEISDTIKPKSSSFEGHVHTRVVDMESYTKLYHYILNNISKFNIPILLGIYTGLRTMEILQMTTFNLHELKERKPTVSIKRKDVMKNKQNHIDNDEYIIYWKPIYNTYLYTCINLLLQMYDDEYKLFIKSGINTKLFPIQANTLNYRIKNEFYKANNYSPPYGFGIHTCRYMTASIMNETSGSLPAIQQFLQHKSMKTTRLYMKGEYSFATREFNRITKAHMSNVLNSLDVAELPSVCLNNIKK